MDREDSLEKLLKPITWPWSSSVKYRQDLVHERQKHVRMVLPFLNDSETARAETWLIEESHSELWD